MLCQRKGASAPDRNRGVATLRPLRHCKRLLVRRTFDMEQEIDAFIRFLGGRARPFGKLSTFDAPVPSLSSLRGVSRKKDWSSA